MVHQMVLLVAQTLVVVVLVERLLVLEHAQRRYWDRRNVMLLVERRDIHIWVERT